MEFENQVLHRFKTPLNPEDKPKQFPFPFYFQAEEWSALAAADLQRYLEQLSKEKNNPLDSLSESCGKMFGVLLVEDLEGNFAYLAAFSGKLNQSNDHKGFVPPIYDLSAEDSFYKKGEDYLIGLNKTYEKLKKSKAFLDLKTALEQAKAKAETDEKAQRAITIEQRRLRKIQRKEAIEKGTFDSIEAELIKQSYHYRHQLKTCIANGKSACEAIEVKLEPYLTKLNSLKTERKQFSAKLQSQLFEAYVLKNQNRETKTMWAVFQDFNQSIPPGGSGECCAPKLLQYAYNHGLKPISLAEFWWGKSLKSDLKKHKLFYPSCRGKCEPILDFMLQGVDVSENPMSKNWAADKVVETIYEDDHILLINKPADLLSVPGKTITDSVYSRIMEKFPDLDSPLIVHRLDMSTSGLMLLAKTKNAHKSLQKQFIERTITKQYVAVLEGQLQENEGLVNLPLILNINDRPRQIISYEHGKSAETHWFKSKANKVYTQVYFYPKTGRTHQLRVHSAHHLGLNAPILGDDLYGKQQKRLHLHARSLCFKHPDNQNDMCFFIEPLDENWIDI
ncbi:MAG: RluA family pseudouridine synthase [Flavobacteriales bacterium]